ncbi:DUF6531 domain-containing protein [Shigella flexneri]
MPPIGVACRCARRGDVAGHPVDPLLGAKVLPGETDIALPAPLPLVLSSAPYSSYRTNAAPVGEPRPQLENASDIRLQLRDNTLILSDNSSRAYLSTCCPVRTVQPQRVTVAGARRRPQAG